MVETGSTGGVDIPTDNIRNVHFSKPGDPALPAWPAKVGEEAASDLLVVRKKDAVDFDEGVIVSVDENHVNFKLDGEPVSVPRAKIDGLIFFHKYGQERPAGNCVVETADGWRLNAKSVTLSHKQFRIELPKGGFVYVPQDAITRLDFSAGKINYLSDMEPESVRWTPYLEIGKASDAIKRYYAPKRDEGREHQPLSIDGKTYAKGMALCSRTALEYRLPSGAKNYKPLQASTPRCATLATCNW